jgi:mannose-6-phosphate isomerase-like protein (cupin superfamily)
MSKLAPTVVEESKQPRDGWDDSVKGRIGWRTLFSGDITPTNGLTAGIAEVQPGGWLGLHRHAPPEIYYMLAGRGVVTLAGAEHAVTAGSAVFIPGDVEHGIRNSGRTVLRFLYAFAADSFSDIEYRFTNLTESS